MAIARIDKFIDQIKPVTTLKEIEALCNQELDYLRQELSIYTTYSEQGYPIGVTGDARRLKTQVSAYRTAIKSLETNSKNSKAIIRNGEKVRVHKALKFFNLAEHEKRDSNTRDRQRVSSDKFNRPSFDAVAVIDKALKLLKTNSYISKVAGLYLLTGRRHEEILITGRFEKPLFDIEDNLLGKWLSSDVDAALFFGQVKRKGNDDKPYNIPLLAPLDVVREVIEWLRINKPHKPGVRPKGSKELGLKVRQEFQNSQLLPTPAGKDNYLNPHSLRSAYAAICWQLYRNSKVAMNCTEDIFVKAIMGHLEESTQSAQSYLDYELNTEESNKLINSRH